MVVVGFWRTIRIRSLVGRYGFESEVLKHWWRTGWWIACQRIENEEMFELQAIKIGVPPDCTSGSSHSRHVSMFSSVAGLQRSRSGMLSGERSIAPAELGGGCHYQFCAQSTFSFPCRDVDVCSFLPRYVEKPSIAEN